MQQKKNAERIKTADYIVGDGLQGFLREAVERLPYITCQNGIPTPYFRREWIYPLLGTDKSVPYNGIRVRKEGFVGVHINPSVNLSIDTSPYTREAVMCSTYKKRPCISKVFLFTPAFYRGF